MTHKVIALTGGIGSGKSTVSQYIRNKGYCVLDCDAIAREVANDTEVLQEVVLLLGQESVKQGKINRPYVRQTIFGDSQLLQRYNAIFFNRIARALDKKVSACQTEFVFVEIAVFDAFSYPWYAVWRVDSSTEVRVSRIVNRDKVDVTNAVAVISAQKQYDSDYVIVNDGTLQQLYNQVEVLLNKLNDK